LGARTRRDVGPLRIRQGPASVPRLVRKDSLPDAPNVSTIQSYRMGREPGQLLRYCPNPPASLVSKYGDARRSGAPLGVRFDLDFFTRCGRLALGLAARIRGLLRFLSAYVLAVGLKLRVKPSAANSEDARGPLLVAAHRFEREQDELSLCVREARSHRKP